MKKYIGTGLKAGGSNLNVVNILRTLVEDENCKVYIPVDYEKETRLNTDENVTFIKDAKCEVTNLVSNQERFNVSFRVIVPVLVNGENKKVWREYTVIRDGKLNVKSVWAVVNDYYEVLSSANLIKSENDGMVEINLENCPLISLNWAQPNQCHLYDLMKEDVELSEELKVARKAVKELKTDEEPETINSEFYTENRTYSAESKNNGIADCIVYDLPEYKATSNSVYETFESAQNAKKELSKKQADVRFHIRMIVWAIESSAKKGSYNWTELADLPRSKDKKFQTTIVDNNGEQLKLRKLVYSKQI